MSQFQGVPGPSQDAFDTLNSKIGNFALVGIGAVSSSSPRVVNISNNACALIIAFSGNSGRSLLAFARTASGGTVNCFKFDSSTFGTNITLDDSVANKITITSSSSSNSNLFALVLEGTVSV